MDTKIQQMIFRQERQSGIKLRMINSEFFLKQPL